jgi:hypothetical protein
MQCGAEGVLGWVCEKQSHHRATCQPDPFSGQDFREKSEIVCELRLDHAATTGTTRTKAFVAVA